MILQPQLKPSPRPNSNDVSRTMSSYRVNEPQANAILSSLSSNGFSLIQGYANAFFYHLPFGLNVLSDHLERVKRGQFAGLLVLIYQLSPKWESQ